MKICKQQFKKIVKEEMEASLAAQAAHALEKAEAALADENFRMAISYANHGIKLVKLAMNKPAGANNEANKNLLRKFVDLKDSLTRGPG
jgi:hypothetical protein